MSLSSITFFGIKNLKNKTIYNQKMKNPQIYSEFMLTSPEQELRQISMGDTLQKMAQEQSKFHKISNQIFTIDSWNISQKLNPSSDQKWNRQMGRYKDSISTQLTSKLNRERVRTHSTFRKKDIQTHNSHNFNNRKKNSLLFQNSKKTLEFIEDASPRNPQTKRNQHISKKMPTNQKTFKSRKALQRQIVKQKQQRMNSIQSYLNHQKQQMNRQRLLVHSQRIGKQSVNLLQYPTQYWQGGKKSVRLVSKNKKNRYNNTSMRIPLRQNQAQKAKFQSISVNFTNLSSKPLHFDRKPLEQPNKSQSESTKSKSPKKRFQNFVDRLVRINLQFDL